MPNKIFLFALLSGFVFAETSTAQSFLKHGESDGYIELSYIDVEGVASEVGIVADFDRSYRLFGNIGVDFGLEGFSYNDTDIGTVYLAATYTVPQVGKFSIGAPRLAYDSVNISRTSRIFNIIGALAEDYVSSSVVSYEALRRDEQPYGVRYDGEFGRLYVAASFHRIEIRTRDLDAASLAFAYQFGEWSLQGAYENASLEGVIGDRDSYSIGAHADLGKYLYGISYHNIDGLRADQTMLEGYFSYRPTDRIEVTATIADISRTPDTSYGISGKYRFWENAYGELAAKHSSTGRDIYQLNLGWNF